MSDTTITEQIITQTTRTYSLTPASDDESLFAAVVTDGVGARITYTSREGNSVLALPVGMLRDARAFLSIIDADLSARVPAPDEEPPAEEPPVETIPSDEPTP